MVGVYGFDDIQDGFNVVSVDRCYGILGDAPGCHGQVNIIFRNTLDL